MQQQQQHQNPQQQRPPKNAAAASGNPRGTSKSRKPTNLVVGKKVVNGLVSLRGADLTINLYVGNVNIHATIEEMRTEVSSQGVEVVDLEEIDRTHNRFKSFRLCVRKTDLPKITDADFWPSGVVVRRFFRRKQPTSSVLPSIQ